MAKEKNELGITVKKEDDMPEWYSQVVQKSGLADYSAVKGCAVIRPLGYAIWQKIMDYFNERLKVLETDNAYFPLFIPESFFYREAEHVEGFAPEVAWVERKDEGEERVAVRPTSETIMYDSYSKWIRSYRDLPLKINQWANVVRWEVKDVKLFLRSREFLWQEGHCVFEDEKGCDENTTTMIKEYKQLSEDLLAVPAFIGLKSEKEKFPGAKYTYTIESLMPDGKSLQAGTSHNLGQGFGKAFNIKFTGRDEKEHTPWQNSWGFSTRLLGSIIMVHGDDKGLVLSPKIAPKTIVIVPIIFKNDKELSKKVIDKAYEIKDQLLDANRTWNITIDDREEYSPGFKFSEWELKGVPLRIEIGPKDLEANKIVVAKRNTGEKIDVPLNKVSTEVPKIIGAIHDEMLSKAREVVNSNIKDTNNYDEMVNAIQKEGKMVLASHCGQKECEEEIKTETNGITTRCRPFQNDNAQGQKCIKCQNDAVYKIYFARNY